MSILHISTSPQQAGSHSRELGRHLVERLKSAIDLPAVVRDLAETPPPFPCAGFVQASLSASTRSFANKSDALTVSEHLIAEVEQASAIIIDMPMHNFTVPAAFKAWIDMVVRPERTFRPCPRIADRAARPKLTAHDRTPRSPGRRSRAAGRGRSRPPACH
ncbi:hypothetical protein GRI39_12920 [Altererythrobacter indicus]|uniref:Flavodoxin-like fold domain-containing protein n=1 Tax=Altericroceibacterium indicum TaxID=374177 RepID=A0A845ADR0_9SPHN|nr:hypothetical protein [Altericroceibacterium indicum]